MKSKTEIENKANEATAAWSSSYDSGSSYFEGVMMALQWVIDEDAPDPMVD